ncbi:hypothetical protein [Magnetospirillum aberrantis]|uniref:Uncharacterized protein n=1 Tax=Magnetospirillum aberrantis SpK TaxID=908842 RepID=A0A7C9QRV2_9PROT|nr:hypothetical protein [Magnetospirillum aberrantis]NFV79003.1 hypothetical protein [Magnetospirillum aberrantis SpK]
MDTKRFAPSWTPAPQSGASSGTCSSASKLEAIERRLESIERTLWHLSYHIQSTSPTPTTAPQPEPGHVPPMQVPSW